MNGTGEKVGGGEPFWLVSEIFKPKAVPCESRRVARHINYAFGRHFYDFRQKHFGAAFARRVNDDDIGARTLGGQLGRGGTGVLAAEVGLVSIQPQPGGGLLRAPGRRVKFSTRRITPRKAPLGVILIK